jgi:hypothetical protein
VDWTGPLNPFKRTQDLYTPFSPPPGHFFTIACCDGRSYPRSSKRVNYYLPIGGGTNLLATLTGLRPFPRATNCGRTATKSSARQDGAGGVPRGWGLMTCQLASSGSTLYVYSLLTSHSEPLPQFLLYFSKGFLHVTGPCIAGIGVIHQPRIDKGIHLENDPEDQ